MIYVQTLLAVGVFYLVFCRLHRTDGATKWEVRTSITSVGASSFALAIGPWIGWDNGPLIVAFLGSVFISYLASAQAWSNGVPYGLEHGERRGLN